MNHRIIQAKILILQDIFLKENNLNTIVYCRLPSHLNPPGLFLISLISSHNNHSIGSKSIII